MAGRAGASWRRTPALLPGIPIRVSGLARPATIGWPRSIPGAGVSFPAQYARPLPPPCRQHRPVCGPPGRRPRASPSRGMPPRTMGVPPSRVTESKSRTMAFRAGSCLSPRPQQPRGTRSATCNRRPHAIIGSRRTTGRVRDGPRCPPGPPRLPTCRVRPGIWWPRPLVLRGSTLSGIRLPTTAGRRSPATESKSPKTGGGPGARWRIGGVRMRQPIRHTRLPPNTTRHYRVSAVNRAGTGSLSRVVVATTDADVPGAPTGLAAGANGASRIDLRWTAPNNTGGAPIIAYRIEVSENAGRSWSDLVSRTPSARTTYSHTGLPAGSTRHYRVSAINRIGTGEPSGVAPGTTASTVPGTPTALSARADGTTRIDLSWNVPARGWRSAHHGLRDRSFGRWRFEVAAAGCHDLAGHDVHAPQPGPCDHAPLSGGRDQPCRCRIVLRRLSEPPRLPTCRVRPGI